MWEVVRARRSFFGASLVAVLVVATVGIAALNSRGYRTTKVDLNSGEVWTVNHNEAHIGRVNMQIPDLDASVVATSSADVLQDADTVLIVAGNKLVGVDPAEPQGISAGRQGEQRPLPADAQVALGGPTGAVLARASGDLWVTPRQNLVTQSSSAPRTTNVGPNAVMAIGTDGTVYAYAQGTKKVTIVHPSGSVSSTSLAASVAKDPQLTVVGTTPVVLDAASHRLLVGGGATADLGAAAKQAQLQQPGPPNSKVLVDATGGLYEVALGGGSPRSLYGHGAAGPAAPVRLGPCVYGAWSTHAVRLCDGRKTLVNKVPAQDVASAHLVYRVNHDDVLLNDSTSGWMLAYTYDQAVPLDDWVKVIDKDKTQPPKDLKPDLAASEKKPDCATASHAFTAVDYAGGTRVGQPAILHVLDGVKQPACEVLRVALDGSVVGTTLAKTIPGKGTVAVVDDGDALQFTPTVSGPTTVSFPFWVGNGVDTPQQRTATVTVLAATCTATTNDHAPVVPAAAGVTPLLVATGKRASYNVLNQARDLDGDLLSLVDAEVSHGSGSVQYQTDGEVTFTAAATGTSVITYHVADQCGAQTAGAFDVVVQGASTPLPPSAQPAHLQLIAGEHGTINLLATASDPANLPLTLQSVQPDTVDGWVIQVDPDGTLDVQANVRSATSHTFQYTISNGTRTAQSSLRVDVLAPDAHDTPIAVRDSLLLRPGVPGSVDLTANDVDPGGAVLAVQSVEPGDGETAGQLQLELIDLHILRVTAPGGFTGTATVLYTVSNGSESAQGSVVVQAIDRSLTLQAPVPAPDTATAKVGNIVAIPVLQNDVDPQGGRLTLTAVSAPPSGTAWIEGDELRFQASATGAGTQRFTYTVANAVGNASGVVTVHVQPANAPRQPLKVPLITERVFAGGAVVVHVPLLTVSPDGDIVSVTGLVDPPTLGHATLAGDGFVYTADPASTGTDTFTYRLRSDHGDEAVGTVRLAVIPRPAQEPDPVAVPVTVDVALGDQRAIDVLASVNNPYGDVLSIGSKGADAFTQPTLGHVELADGEFRYQAPSSAKDGAQTSFSYVVLTDRGGSAHGTVTVTLHKKVAPEPPVARDDFTVAQKPNTDVVVDVLANDSDPMGHLDSLKVEPGGGATFGADRKVHLHVGEQPVRFTYKLVNPALPGQPAEAVVTIPVLNASKGPITSPISLTMTAGESRTINVLDAVTVAPGRTKQLLKADKPRGGTIKVDAKHGRVTFTAAADAAGDGGFNYLVTDGKGGFASDQVQITIRGIHAPTWPPQQISLPADSTRSVDLDALLTTVDPGNTYAFAVSGGTDAVKATTQAAGDHTNLVLTASTDAHGKVVKLAVKATNHGQGSTKVATNEITVTVTGTDKPPPTAVDDTARTDQGKPVVIPVVANDVDPVGKGLKIMSVSAVGADQGTGRPAGSASANGNAITFSPAADFYGSAHFTYTIEDATGEASHQSTANVSVVVEGIPGTPGVPSGTASSHQVLLTWAPADPHGDYPITYDVQSSQADGGFTTVASDVGTNSTTVTGLANGHDYTFRVQAKNKAGDSPWSAASPPQNVDAVPDPPTVISATATNVDAGGGALKVTWSEAKPDGSPIVGYKVVYNGTPSPELGADATSYVIDGLQNGTTYSITVLAQNSAKANGGWSDPSVAQTAIPATSPPPVPAPSVTQGDQTLVVTWSPRSGAAEDGGHEVDTYRVFVANTSACSASDPHYDFPAGDSNTQTLPAGSLTNGQSYYVCMAALNDVTTTGNEHIGAAYGPVVPAGHPGPPTSVTVTPMDRGIQFTYSGANPNGPPIDSAQVTMGGTSYNTSAVSGSSGSFIVTGLSNGTTYSAIQVKVCHSGVEAGAECSTAVGSSPSSVTPFGAPTGAHVTGTVSGNSIHWSWSASPNGAPITSYTLSGAASGTTTATSTTTSYGCGAATATLTVTFVSTSQGQTQRSSASRTVSKGDTCPPPPPKYVVTFSRGPAASLSVCYIGDPTSCYWVDVSVSDFPAGNYQIKCYDPDGSAFPITSTITVNSAGTGSAQSQCAAQAGYSMYVSVGGHNSTTHGLN